jgi:hypothetical protein
MRENRGFVYIEGRNDRQFGDIKITIRAIIGHVISLEMGG